MNWIKNDDHVNSGLDKVVEEIQNEAPIDIARADELISDAAGYLSDSSCTSKIWRPVLIMLIREIAGLPGKPGACPYADKSWVHSRFFSYMAEYHGKKTLSLINDVINT